MRIAILASTDLVWGTSVWEATIPRLQEAGHDIAGFWEITGRPGKQPSHVRTFGMATVGALAGYAGTVVLKRLLRRRPLSFEAVCRRHKVSYARAENPNREWVIQALEATAPEAIIAMTPFILKEKLINIPEKGIINKHAALLPANKGIMPYVWATIKGEPNGVSYHIMNKKIDEGDIIYQYDLSDHSFRSMIHFYNTVFAHYEKDMPTVLDRLARGLYSEGSGLPPSYHGFPERTDIRAFRRAGGRVLTWRDFA